jgi:hypothetical protein
MGLNCRQRRFGRGTGSGPVAPQAFPARQFGLIAARPGNEDSCGVQREGKSLNLVGELDAFNPH